MLNKICRTFTYLKHLFKVFFNWWMRSVLLCVCGGGGGSVDDYMLDNGSPIC